MEGGRGARQDEHMSHEPRAGDHASQYEFRGDHGAPTAVKPWRAKISCAGIETT